MVNSSPKNSLAFVAVGSPNHFRTVEIVPNSPDVQTVEIDLSDSDNWAGIRNDYFLQIREMVEDDTASSGFSPIPSAGEVDIQQILFTEGSILSTNESEILDMVIYPNPVEGNFVTIQSPVDGSKDVQVYTVTGRKVIDTTINGNTLDVSSLNSGFYMINVTINGQSKISKLVVR
jgi:hypothetical protein